MAKSTQISNSSSHKKEGRNLFEEQLATVARAFVANDIDLKHLYGGVMLYKSLRAAKARTKGVYKKKGIKFNFNNSESIALIEVIKGDPIFWSKWIAQQDGDFKASGFDEKYRPSLHRIDPNGHYEIGNIDVIPYGEHIKEQSIETAMLAVDENGNLLFEKFESKTQAKTQLNLNDDQLSNVQQSHLIEFTDSNEVSSDKAATKMFGGKYTVIGPFDNEEQRKAVYKELGRPYELPAVTNERINRMMKQVKAKKG